jgi:hypothetical protein
MTLKDMKLAMNCWFKLQGVCLTVPGQLTH